MIPTTLMPLRKNEAAAVEITALAAGAGPPANKIATLRIVLSSSEGLASASVVFAMIGLSLAACESWILLPWGEVAMCRSRTPCVTDFRAACHARGA